MLFLTCPTNHNLSIYLEGNVCYLYLIICVKVFEYLGNSWSAGINITSLNRDGFIIVRFLNSLFMGRWGCSPDFILFYFFLSSMWNCPIISHQQFRNKCLGTTISGCHLIFSTWANDLHSLSLQGSNNKNSNKVTTCVVTLTILSYWMTLGMCWSFT